MKDHAKTRLNRVHTDWKAYDRYNSEASQNIDHFSRVYIYIQIFVTSLKSNATIRVILSSHPKIHIFQYRLKVNIDRNVIDIMIEASQNITTKIKHDDSEYD